MKFLAGITLAMLSFVQIEGLRVSGVHYKQGSVAAGATAQSGASVDSSLLTDVTTLPGQVASQAEGKINEKRKNWQARSEQWGAKAEGQLKGKSEEAKGKLKEKRDEQESQS